MVIILEQIIQLKNQGLTWRQIGDKLGIERECARSIYRRSNKTKTSSCSSGPEVDTIGYEKQMFFEKVQKQEVAKLKRELQKVWRKEYLLEQADELVNENMRRFSKEYTGPMVPLVKPTETGKMLEISIVDLHLGKLSWEPETTENYDHKIAERRFMKVIYDITERTKHIKFEKIIFPIGNDFFNFDLPDGTTTGGTLQNNDLRYQKMYDKGIELLVKAIDILAVYAPVEVILVPGNHDMAMSYYCAKTIQAWFRNNENITVNAGPTTRKYVEFGKCLIGFTHGDKERKRLFGNMQVEAAEAWGRTTYREWHVGHLHSEQTKEENGVIVRNLSSVTSTDSWHYQQGYRGAICKSQSFVWDRENGLTDILMTNIL